MTAMTAGQRQLRAAQVRADEPIPLAGRVPVPPFPVNALPTDPAMAATSAMVPTANEVPHAEVVDDDPGDLSDAALPVLAKMVDRYHAEAEAELRTAQGAVDRYLVAAWHSGRVLTEVKSRLKHGEFLPWVTQNTKISTRTAQRYKEVFEKAPRVSHLVGHTSIRKFLESHAEPKAAKRKRQRKPIRPPSSAPHVKKWRTHIWQLQEHALALNNLKDGKEFGAHRAAVMRAHADDVAWAKKIVTDLDAALSGGVSTPETKAADKAAELVEKIMADVDELAEHIRNRPEMDSTAINMTLSTSATPLRRSLDGWLRNNFPALRHAIPADVVAAFHDGT